MTTKPGTSPTSDELAVRDLCSLSPEQLALRLARIRQDVQPLVVACAELPDGVVWEFDRDAGTRERLTRLAALERECCGPGLEFRVQEDPRTDRLRFEIHGAEAGALRALVGEGTSALPSGVLKRFARAAGFGVVMSLLVCCLIPLGVAAIAGVSIAGPLLKLDDPLILGSVAGVFAIALGWLQGRRAARPASPKVADSPESGCSC